MTDTHWKVGIEDGKREYCVKWLNYNTHKEDTSQAKSPGLGRIIDDIRRVRGLRIRDFNILFGRGVAGAQLTMLVDPHQVLTKALKASNVLMIPCKKSPQLGWSQKSLIDQNTDF